MKTLKKILALIAILCLSVSVISGCGPDKDTTKDSDTKKEKVENVKSTEKETEEKEPEEEPEEEEFEEEVFDTATPITPFYVDYEDYPKNQIPSLMEPGNYKFAIIRGESSSSEAVCIDTKEKALSYLAKAKKHNCAKIVYLIPSDPGTLQGPSYEIDEVIEGYENGTWTFANAVEDYKKQAAETERKLQEEHGYKPGTISNKKYESKFLGLGFELPADWSITKTPESPDKEMYTEVGAKNSKNETMLITFTKDTEETESYTESTYTAAYKNSFEKKLESEYSSSTVTSSLIKTGAKTYNGLTMTATKNNTTTYMTLFVVKCYDRTATIFLSSEIDDDFSDVLDTFFTVN